jgi:hypothetical protein
MIGSLVVGNPSPTLPVLVAATGDRAGVRFLEFYAANIRNPHTRRAYARAVGDFLAWCESLIAKESEPESNLRQRSSQ